MTNIKVTSHELKKINRAKVYQYIYENKASSRPEIAHALEMSFPTVTQNLNELEDMGLILKSGYQQSTGGRKAQRLSCNPTARIAVGIELEREDIRLIAIDLYANILKEQLIPLEFSNTDKYFRTTCNAINVFISDLELPTSQILGIGIAIQGIVSVDGTYISYGKVLDCTGLTLRNFSQYLNLPCSFIQASKASTYAEHFQHRELTDAAYISLNSYLGSGLIMNGEIYQGVNSLGGIFEHMLLIPGGRKCYCGNSGCNDSYCSAHYIKEESGVKLNAFFKELRNGNEKYEQIWKNYLYYLSIAISNIRFVVDCDFIIGGTVKTYFTENDYNTLNKLVNDNLRLPGNSSRIILGQYGDQAAAIGAALKYIRAFLEAV